MAMKKLADKCGTVTDDQLIGFILNGINDQRLFDHLYSKDFNDFSHFLERLSLRAEGRAFMENRQQETRVFAMEELRRDLPQQQQQPSQPRPPPRCWFCNKIGHRIRDCRQMQRQREAGRQSYGGSNDRRGDRVFERENADREERRSASQPQQQRPVGQPPVGRPSQEPRVSDRSATGNQVFQDRSANPRPPGPQVTTSAVGTPTQTSAATLNPTRAPRQ